MKLFDSFKQKERKAFTLVELLVVVAIIGILFIVLMASVNWSTDTARETGVQTDMRAYQTAANAVGLEAAGFPEDVKTLSTMLNKRLDPNMEINVNNGQLVTARQDPWGTAYRIDYNRPNNSKGQLAFTSAGPNTTFGDSDDIITVIRYEVGEGNRGNIVIENPKNDEFHTHTYDQRIEDAKYLYKEATCTSVSQYYFSCSCGAMGTTLFEVGSPDDSKHGTTTFTYIPVTGDMVYHQVKEECEDCGAEISLNTEAHVKRETPLGTMCSKCELTLHSHQYDNIVADGFIKIAATCERNAVYYQSCSCGQVSDGTFEAPGTQLGHDFTAQITDAAYVLAAGDCVTEDTYVKSCSYCRLKDPNNANTFTSGGVRSNHKAGAGYSYSAVSKDSQFHFLIAYCNACTKAVNQQELPHRWDSNNNCADCSYHEHLYTLQMIDDKFKDKDASCLTSATYFYSCACGEKGTETFAYGGPAGHQFADRVLSNHLKSYATCSTYAEYWQSCSVPGCNERGVLTFFDTNAGYNRQIHAEQSQWIKEYNYKDIENHSITFYCPDCNSFMANDDQKHTGTNSCTLCGMHRHEFTRQLIQTEYKASDKTCSSYAKYYYSCPCGEKGLDTFDDIASGYSEHIWTNRPTEEYLSTVATCQKGASYYKSCQICALSSEKTAAPEVFTHGDKNLTNHTGQKAIVATAGVCVRYSCCSEEVKAHNYKLTDEKAVTCLTNGSKTYTCDVCSHSYTENITSTGHMWVEATCTLPAICAKCNATNGEKLGHMEHSDPAKRPSCLTSGYCGRCNEQVFAPLGHLHPIDTTTGQQAKPTCTEPVICGRLSCNVQLVAPTGHNASGALASCQSGQICANPGCSVELSPRINHVYNITEPTCTKAKYCVMCYNISNPTYPADQARPALGHNYDMTKRSCTTAAQCLTCKIYADYNDPNYGALKHDITVHDRIDPTCDELGYSSWEECTRDGCDYQTNKDTIPVLGHIIIQDVAVDPTCENTGLTSGAHCTRTGCDYVVEQQIIPALGHNYNKRTNCTDVLTCTRLGCSSTDGPFEHVPGKAATCTEAEKCAECGADINNALGHIWVDATCTTNLHCSRCNIQEENTATGHLWYVNVPAKAETCTTAGNDEGRACRLCDAIQVLPTPRPALGHKYDVVFQWNCRNASNEPITQLPFNTSITCTATGVCSICSDKFSVAIPSTATTTQERSCTDYHEWNHVLNWSAVKDTIPTEQAEAIETCMPRFNNVDQCGCTHVEESVLSEHTYGNYQIDPSSTCQAVVLKYKCTICNKQERVRGMSVIEWLQVKDCVNEGQYKYNIAFADSTLYDKYVELNGNGYCPCKTIHKEAKQKHLMEISGNIYFRDAGTTGTGTHAYIVKQSVPFEMVFTARCTRPGCSLGNNNTYVIKQYVPGSAKTQIIVDTIKELSCTQSETQQFKVSPAFYVEGFNGLFSNHADWTTKTKNEYFVSSNLVCCKEAHVSQAKRGHNKVLNYAYIAGCVHKSQNATLYYSVKCTNAECKTPNDTGTKQITQTSRAISTNCNNTMQTYNHTVSSYTTPILNYSLSSLSCEKYHNQTWIHLENPNYVEESSGYNTHHIVTFYCDRASCKRPGSISRQYSAPHYNDFPIYWYFMYKPYEYVDVAPEWYFASVGDVRDYRFNKYEYQVTSTTEILGATVATGWDWVYIGHSDFYNNMVTWVKDYNTRMTALADLHKGKNDDMEEMFRGLVGRFDDFTNKSDLLNEIKAWRTIEGKLNDLDATFESLEWILCKGCGHFQQLHGTGSALSLNMDHVAPDTFSDQWVVTMENTWNNKYHGWYKAFQNNGNDLSVGAHHQHYWWFVDNNAYFTSKSGWDIAPDPYD